MRFVSERFRKAHPAIVRNFMWVTSGGIRLRKLPTKRTVGARAAKPAVQTRDPEAAALRTYRKQLAAAFMFAHDRGLVETALLLLCEGVPACRLEAALTSMAPQSQRYGLPARMDAYQATTAAPSAGAAHPQR